ncbi:sensor histidine kinase [Glaciibacter sp. 2TAF33]|uniref:sensor histidine kinase n=1 Tax=Glaciibacter sp. 2TAF33 TaxID=3233015 RepID=UPI003F9395E9
MSTHSFSPGPAPGGELRGGGGLSEEDLRLPTPPGVIRQFWARHPWLLDSLVAVLYLLLTAIALVADSGATKPSPGSTLILKGSIAVVLAVVLLFRRRAPLPVLALGWLGLIVPYLLYGEGEILPVLIALYAVAVYDTTRHAWIGLGISVVLTTAGALIGHPEPAPPAIGGAIQYAVVMLVATLLGINIGNRRRYVTALLDRAAQLARERDQQAQLARISERARIAREMHDIVAHSLSVIVALADGAEAINTKNPERASAAMRQVAQTGRSSMAEMRRLLGVLGADDGDALGTADGDAPAAAATGDTAGGFRPAASLSPQPGVTDMAVLVESFRSAGLATRLETIGTPPANPGLQLTVYRIVQESLTNALRYATHASAAVVRLVVSAERVEVTVSDDGRPRPGAPSQGSGRGLIGLRERVALYGGTLDAGPVPGGGWRVRATMEITDTAADTGTGAETEDTRS